MGLVTKLFIMLLLPQAGHFVYRHGPTWIKLKPSGTAKTAPHFGYLALMNWTTACQYKFVSGVPTRALLPFSLMADNNLIALSGIL
jgi:hypothetical protein